MTRLTANVKTVAFIEPNDATGWSVEKTASGWPRRINTKLFFRILTSGGPRIFTPSEQLIVAKPGISSTSAGRRRVQALMVKQMRELGYKGQDPLPVTDHRPGGFCKIAG